MCCLVSLLKSPFQYNLSFGFCIRMAVFWVCFLASPFEIWHWTKIQLSTNLLSMLFIDSFLLYLSLHAFVLQHNSRLFPCMCACMRTETILSLAYVSLYCTCMSVCSIYREQKKKIGKNAESVCCSLLTSHIRSFTALAKWQQKKEFGTVYPFIMT